jgi:dolichol-phosphate mannosyltransferase
VTQSFAFFGLVFFSKMSQHTISIIIPVHNEEKNVPALYAALQSVMAGLTQYDYEYIFVDDGSTDGSVAAICAIVSCM